MKTSPICQHCTTRIQNYGFICLDIMDQICKSTIDVDISYYHELFSPKHIKEIVRFLESKMLLVTTDINEDKVLIRPNIRNGSYDADRRAFCWCRRQSKLQSI